MVLEFLRQGKCSTLTQAGIQQKAGEGTEWRIENLSEVMLEKYGVVIAEN